MDAEDLNARTSVHLFDAPRSPTKSIATLLGHKATVDTRVWRRRVSCDAGSAVEILPRGAGRSRPLCSTLKAEVVIVTVGSCHGDGTRADHHGPAARMRLGDRPGRAWAPLDPLATSSSWLLPGTRSSPSEVQDFRPGDLGGPREVPRPYLSFARQTHRHNDHPDRERHVT